MKRVYLDHNATTSLRPDVRALWVGLLEESLGNPSSLHGAGRRARDLVDRAREQVAGALGVAEEEVLFTSGGTESNNLALVGMLRAVGGRAGLATTRVEHSSVLETAEALERAGHALTLVGVDGAGMPDVDALEAAARHPGCALVSVQAGNNEVGSTPPLAEIGARLADLGAGRPLFHTDAVQALGRLPLRLAEWSVDAASFSAHKVGGPLGVGVLYHRRGVPLEPLLVGGGQEGALRPGTENAPGIAAAALAIELAVAEQEAFAQRTASLAAALWHDVVRQLPSARLVGPGLSSPRLPNTLNIRLPGTDGKVLVTRLDLEGLEVSAGSACASGSVEPSHVLLAMGCNEDEARAGLRLSLGRNTTPSECKRAVEIILKAHPSSRAT